MKLVQPAWWKLLAWFGTAQPTKLPWAPKTSLRSLHHRSQQNVLCYKPVLNLLALLIICTCYDSRRHTVSVALDKQTSMWQGATANTARIISWCTNISTLKSFRIRYASIDHMQNISRYHHYTIKSRHIVFVVLYFPAVDEARLCLTRFSLY